jgi:hypothetical protein
MIVRKTTVALLCMAALLTACAGAPPHGCSNGHQCVLDVRSPSSPSLATHEQSGPLVGLAVSGGGSRSATFSEAVLEELAKVNVGQASAPVSVLERVQYMSGVSGGSLSTAYFALNKPKKDVAVLTETGALSKEYSDFFQRYSKDMRTEWEESLWGPLLSDGTGRAFKIANKWDATIFAGNTFADLRRRETEGDSPYVILNGTSWDSGRRFLFTNLPRSEFSYRFVEETRKHVHASHLPEQEKALLDERLLPESDRFSPITPEDINADLSSLKVAFAAATSASVPLLIGPVLYSVGDVNCGKELCWHVGDGGMFDNQGVESLAQVFFGKLLAQPAPEPQAAARPRKGLMVVIDGSYPMHDLNFGEADWVFSYLTKSPSRLSDIMEERALGYQLLLWSLLRASSTDANRVIPGPDQLQLVYLRHIDAAEAIAARPQGLCKWGDAPQPVAVVLDKLRTIPTRFKVDPECDAPLLHRAAQELVAKNKQRLLDFFAQP